MVRGQGMPSFRHHDLGNLYIQFDVKFPKEIKAIPKEVNGITEDPTAAEKARAKLVDVLGPQPDVGPYPRDMIEDVRLEELDPDSQQRAHGATSMDEDDEDGVPPGAERMQCASQ